MLAAGGLLVAAEPVRILIVVGPSKHPPGTHEAPAGGRLMEYALEHMANVSGVQAEVVYEWPRDRALREEASSVVFIGDTFPPNRFPDAERNLAELEEMMERGCGLVCLHYATGLLGEDVGTDGEHPLIKWMGGYFANRTCPHHQSIAKIFPAATITPAAPGHPVSRGWTEFTIHDEPYIKNYLPGNVTALAVSMLPPEEPRREIVAWGVEREDGGRGIGIVMPHFYKNWSNKDLRRFILNGIVWSAGLEVPAQGVESGLPDLGRFGPESVEFVPRAKSGEAQ